MSSPFAVYMEGQTEHPLIQPGDVYLVQVREGDTLGALAETLVTNATQPSAANAAEEVHVVTFEFRVPTLLPGELFGFMLYGRRATDSNTDDAQVLTLAWDGYFWR